MLGNHATRTDVGVVAVASTPSGAAGATEIVISSESGVPLPSSALNVMSKLPACDASGAHENAPVDPSIVAPDGSGVAEYVSVSASSSVACTVNVSVAP